MAGTVARGWRLGRLWSRTATAALLVLLPALCTACAPRYDDATDQMQLDAQKKLDAGLLRLQGDREVLDDARSQPGQVSAQDLTAVSKDASFAANIAFYADVETDLSLLQARLLANGDRSAPRIAAAAGNAASAVKRVHDLHEKDGVPSVSYLETARLTIDQAFQPLTLYQAQLRSGG